MGCGDLMNDEGVALLKKDLLKRNLSRLSWATYS